MRRADLVLVGITLVSATAWYFLRGSSPEPEPGSRALPRPTASPRAGSAPSPGRPSPASSRARAAAPPGLTVEADVPEADVFVDRVFRGKAPVTLDDVAPGPHRINVSAEGFDGYAETVEVTGGPQTVSVRFKQVRLAASVDVVHRHGIGSCRGRLSATPAGLRYAPTKGDDGFDVPLAAVERLDAEYMKKSLVVKLRGGRTYNFTEPRGNADALLAFQQAVAKAQARLASAPQQ